MTKLEDIDKEEKKAYVAYTGLFLEESKGLLLSSVPTVFDKVYANHLTLVYKPKDGLDGIEIGREVKVKIVGQVIDQDIGIQACVLETSDDFKSNNEHPHITISAREGVPPFKSNEAIEKAYSNSTVIIFDKPIEITLKEGFFNGSKAITKKETSF